MDEHGDRYDDVLGRVFAGRKVIVTGAPVAGLTGWVDALRRLGSQRCLLIGGGLGTGPVPDESDAEWVLVDVAAPDPVAEFRRWEAVLGDPPPAVREALDRYDPDRRALLVIVPFQAVEQVAGRPAFGPRRPAWVTLEDKTTCDDLFDAAGVVRPPCAVVAPEADPLRAAARRIDRGDGTVWAGDARDGFNGGAVFVRRISAGGPSADELDEATRFYAAHCAQVRVAPFLEGIPCSIHGMAAADGVAVFRPVEMITLRPARGDGFRYAGAATFWDPPDPDREAMREAARRIGTLLRDGYEYRGAFGIDGVLGTDGFLPTELNPRFGAGLGQVARGVPDLPIQLLHLALVADPGMAIGVGELEELVVGAADRCRAGGAWTMVERAWTETTLRPVVSTGEQCTFTDDETAATATLLTGPASAGGFVRLTSDLERTPVGPSAAPRAVAAFALADRELGAGIGPLHPARPVR